jgi:hypothetical protein
VNPTRLIGSQARKHEIDVKALAVRVKVVSRQNKSGAGVDPGGWHAQLKEMINARRASRHKIRSLEDFRICPPELGQVQETPRIAPRVPDNQGAISQGGGKVTCDCVWLKVIADDELEIPLLDSLYR